MILPSRLRMIFKTISALVAGIFLFEQVAWAGDLIDAVLNRQYQEQAQTFAPAYLQNQQAAVETLIDQKQAIEDLSSLQYLTQSSQETALEPVTPDLIGPRGGGQSESQLFSSQSLPIYASQDGSGQTGNPPSQDPPILSVTTSAGDIIHYRGDGSIDYIEKKDDKSGGMIIISRIGEKDIVDADNNLLNAKITYPDTTILIIDNGKVITITKPDETIYNYNKDGVIEFVTYPGPRRVDYTYTFDTDGEKVTVLKDSEKIVSYGSDNRLKRVEFISGNYNGKKIEYKNGVISKITETDNSIFIFDVKTNSDDTVSSALSQYVALNGNIYRYGEDENGSLIITIEKNGATATYDKDGNLINIVLSGVTPEQIATAQKDYNDAVSIYNQKKAYRESCETVLNNTGINLTTKTIAKDELEKSLAGAIESYNNALTAKDLKEEEYNNAYNQYTDSQNAYDQAQSDLNDALLVESKLEASLISLQDTLSVKESILNDKIAIRQAVEARIASLNTELASYQSQLTQAQIDLSQALSEESTAQTEFNQAQTDVNTKQAAYDAAKKYREDIEALYNSGGGNAQAKIDAEQALSDDKSYALSSYTYSPDGIELNQCRTFINDQFDSYDSALWHKPADSLVYIGNGVATLKGTGYDYSATLYSNTSYKRTDNFTFKTGFKVSSTSGYFISGLDGYTSFGQYRRIGITVRSGGIYVQTVSGTSSSTTYLGLSAKANTEYSLEFESRPDAINIYLWESSLPKPTKASYTYIDSYLTPVKPYYSLLSGTATVDYAVLKGPDFKSTYDSNSRLVKDTYTNSYLAYSYSPDRITVSSDIAATRYILSTSLEYAQIMGRNQLVQNLKNAIETSNITEEDVNNARTRESEAYQALITSQSTLSSKESILNEKISLRQAVESRIANINTNISAIQSQLSQYQIDLTNARNEETLAQSEYNQAQEDLNVVQTAYTSAIEDRIEKEGIFNAAANDLAIKIQLKNEAYIALDSAIQAINIARALKDTAQAEYDNAYSQYLTSKAAYDEALVNLNNTITEENTANETAKRLLEYLNTIALFPEEDTVLKLANQKIEARYILYNIDRYIQRVDKMDGTTQNYTDGLISGILNGSETTLYRYDLTSLDNINEIAVDRDGIKRIYNSVGDLKILSLNNVENMIYENGGIKEIRKADGTVIRIENPEDITAAGEIINATVERPDKVVVTYKVGVVVKIIKPDGETFDYKDGVIENYSKEGIAYTYSTTADEGIEGNVSEEALGAMNDDEVIYQKYDSDKKLIQLRRKNGEIMDYYYGINGAGSVTVATGIIENNEKSVKTQTIYDKEYNITRTEVFPTAEDAMYTVSAYEYGRIRRVYKNAENKEVYPDGDLIYTYAYEYDSSGKEITVIKDIKTSEVKRYKDELLISVTSPNGLLTIYEYNSDKKISNSIVTYSGRTISKYAYSYDGALTVVEDMDGVRRTYDKDEKIIYLEEKGRTYAYSYSKDDNGRGYQTQELIKVKDESGDLATYNKGILESIVRTDGSVVKDFVYENNSATGYTVEKENNEYFVKGGRVVKKIKAGETIIEYYPNGWAKSVTDPSGTVTNYDYEASMTQSPGFDGAAENTEQENIYIDGPTESSLLLRFDGADKPDHPVEFHSDAHLDANNSKFGSYAVTLDGSGDYVTIPDSDDWNFGSGNFTMESWVKFNSLDKDQGIIGQRLDNTHMIRLFFFAGTGVIGFSGIDGATSNSFYTADSAGFVVDTWYHIAVVRNGATGTSDWKLYINGVSKALTWDSGNGTAPMPDIEAPLDIGLTTGEEYLNGWIDEVRISKGTARWTDDFIPPEPKNVLQLAAYPDPSQTLLHKSTGSFTSNPILLAATELNTVSWNELTPEGADITVQTRTGNTAMPDLTWSDWSAPMSDPAGSRIDSPVAKYIQYRINMITDDPQKTPRIIMSGDSPVSIDYVKKDDLKADITYATADKDNVKYRYTKDGKLAEVVENNIRYFYDAEYRLIKVIDAGGRIYSYEYSGGQPFISHSGEIRQNLAGDLGAFTNENLKVDDDINGLLVKLSRNQDLDYGDGSDGDLRVEAGDTKTLEDKEYNFSSIYVASGTTLTVKNWDSTTGTGGNLVIKCTGEVRIEGKITTRGAGYAGGEESSDKGGFGSGPGGGTGGNGERSSYGPSHGGGGGYGTIGAQGSSSGANSGGSGGVIYGEDQLTALFMGSGGGAGGAMQGGKGGDGGAGGGIIKIVAQTITVSGVISADGAGGGSRENSLGGGGSGGSILLQADEINLSGTVSAKGGSGGGTGGDGRIRVDYAKLTGNMPTPAPYLNGLIYSEEGILMSSPIPVTVTTFGDIIANIDRPSSTSVRFFTRTGASSDINDATWSGWIEASGDSAGYKINSPANKYIQYKAVLGTADATKTSSIYSDGGYAIKLNYSYNKTFDANAPPGDLPFKEWLTIAPPDIQSASDMAALRTDLNQIEQISADVTNSIIPEDTPVETKTAKIDLVSEIKLADGTIIKYFNDKPIFITMRDGVKIDDIVIEKVNASMYDYDYVVGSGTLVRRDGSAENKVAASFTATNSNGDTYIFKNDTLTEIRRFGGAVFENPDLDDCARALLKLVDDAFSPALLTGEKEYKNSDVSVSVTKDNKVTYVIGGKIASVYHRYEDGRLELLMDYSYDADGNLILVRLPYARDSIEKEITAVRQNIAAEKAAYLKELAEDKQLYTQQITAQIEEVRRQINAERDRLRPFLYQEVTRQRWVGWWIFGWWETYTETVEVPEFRNALNQLDEQERKLNEEAATAYANLNSEIQAAESRLTEDEKKSLDEVSIQEEMFQEQIIKEESTPVILEWYRSILGRDPDDAETEAALANVDYASKINVKELKDDLANSSERKNQEAFVRIIKERVRVFLNDYLSSSPEDRIVLLQSLGLSDGEVVSLDQKEVDAILAFLDKQNIHFGRSAFVALESLLKDNNIPYILEDLAFKTITIDILSGVINALSEEKLLELSMYSLSKTASLYGLTLYNAKLDFDDLRGLTLTGSDPSKSIAHLKNNHYVIVTNISDDDKVTYVERNIGKDGYTATVSKEEFLKAWTGYAMVRGLTQPGDPTVNEADPLLSILPTSKLLSVEQAQRVKGSCLPFIGLLIGLFIQGITTIVAGVAAVIATVAAAVAAIIAPIISGIATMIAGITQAMIGFAAQVFSAIQFVGVSLLNGVAAFFGGAVLGGGIAAAGSATGFTLTGIGIAIGKTVVLTALSFAVTKGLESIGLSPTIANLISSFITGGISGLFTNFSPIGFIAGSLQNLAVQGINELGKAIGIPSEISNIIGMGAGVVINAGLNGVRIPIDPNNLDLGYKVLTGLDAVSHILDTSVFPTIARDLTCYGINKLGEFLGVDPRIMAALSSAGSVIASSILQNRFSTVADIAASLNRSLNSAVVSYTVKLIDGINPALSTALRSTGLMNAVENILNTNGLFNGVFTIVNKIVPTAFNTAGNVITDLFSGAKTFVELVTEKGPLGAVNTALNSLFTQETIEAVLDNGGIEEALSRPTERVEIEPGMVVNKITVTEDASLFLDDNGELVAVKEGDIMCIGEFVYTEDRGLKMKEGTISGNREIGYTLWADIDDGTAREIKVTDDNGNEVVRIDPERPNGSININYNPAASEFTFTILGALLYFANVYMAKINHDFVESITQKVNAISAGSLFNDTNKFLYALANGIRNPEVNKNRAPTYILNLMNDLNSKSNNNISKETDMFPIPLYQGLTSISKIDGFIDAVKWLLESQNSVNISGLADKVRTDMTTYFIRHADEWNRPIVGMGYSGGFMPLVEGVSSLVYNVKTIVGLGGPSAYIATEWLSVLQHIITAVVNKSIDGVRGYLEELGFLGQFISQFLGAIQNFSDEKLLPLLKDVLKKTLRVANFGTETFPYSSVNTDLIVNVWGSKDIFHELGITDKRENFLGKTTYNIEIIGADHYSYMRDISDESVPYWNREVARFCADLIINSDDENKLLNFLNKSDYVKEETGIYVVRLPGYEAFQ